MNQTEITAAVRLGIKEPKPRRVSDTTIVSTTLRAVKLLGLKIKEKDPGYFNERKAITSNSNVFSFPSDCKKINNIWDYDGDAIVITGAADNGAGLVRITAVDHGFADEAVVTIHDVTGTVEANGTWKITYVDEDTFDLLGSTFAITYVSGGMVFEEKQDMLEITKIEMAEQTGSDPQKWYPRKRQIVVDDTGFLDDIIVDYEGAAAAITDIPDEYHEFLPSWVIINLIEMPKQDDPEYADAVKVKALHEGIIQMVTEDIARSFKTSSGPSLIRNVWAD